MQKITIHASGRITELIVADGSILLPALQEGGYEVIAPCGGNGTCGKCKIHVRDEGNVSSCLYRVDKDIEISLPDRAEARILVSQYKLTRQLPLNPGKRAELAPYPVGIAIDIGTTTVVFYLVNLITGSLTETRALMNPQAIYGADVISRINHCIRHEEGLQQIQSEMIRLINNQINDFATVAGVTPAEIVKIAVTGNTTMLHLLLGVDPSPLAFVPFKPVFTERKNLKASEAGLSCATDAEVVIMPSLSAYVGADITCGLASLAPEKSVQKYLFVDIGTNGEMALVSDDRIFACATAAGPAFEGANISCGMAALEGAISSFVDGNQYTTIGDMPASGICGSGLIDIAAYLSREGLLSAEGQIENAFILTEADPERGIPGLSLTQQDIRELQLAKSAILSGIKILCKNAEVELQELDALYLAGGFGNYINVDSALEIGLLPPEVKGKVIPVGNTSGSGAVLALKSENFYPVVENIISRTTFIELSEDEGFALEFAMNMNFPVPNIM